MGRGPYEGSYGDYSEKYQFRHIEGLGLVRAHGLGFGTLALLAGKAAPDLCNPTHYKPLSTSVSISFSISCKFDSPFWGYYP